MGNTALITGASSGIGMELAKIHAARKGDLVLAARGEKELNELKQELERAYGIKVRVFAGDLTRDDAPQKIYDALREEGIEVDILINNAGFGDYGLFWTADPGKTDTMLKLNMMVLTQFTRLFLPGMVKRGRGRVMNVASTASFVPGPLMSVYYATKHYVLAFSEGVANELKGTGVTMTALCPGPTASGFQAASAMEDSKMVKGAKLPSSREVAEYGYAAMLKGKVVAIHGLMNRIQSALPRFLPRGMTARIVRNMQERSR